MKRILLLMTVVGVLALPSVASASEPADWYLGDYSSVQGRAEHGWMDYFEAKVVDGSFVIKQPEVKWNFRCDNVEGTLAETPVLETKSSNCDSQEGSPECSNFSVEFGSRSNPLVPSIEAGVVSVDSVASRTFIKFGKCPGYVSQVGLGTGVPLHGTWDNATETLKFNEAWLGNGATLTGELQVEGYEQWYVSNAWQNEWEEWETESTFGIPTISVH